MNHCAVPDWGVEDDLRSFHDLFPTSNEKKSNLPPDNELVELLWRNGHVVMQSQTSRKPPPSVGEPKQAQGPDPQLTPAVPLVNPGNLIQEDETASWFQYPLEDSLEKEFCSEFLCEMPITDTLDASKPNKEVMGERERNVRCRATEDGNAFTMPLPKSHVGATQLVSSLGNGGHVGVSHFSRPMKAGMGSLRPGSGVVVGVGGSSSIGTVGSSACGSNHVQNLADVSNTWSNGGTRVLGKGVKEDGPMISPRERLRANTFDTTVTSSSDGSGCSFGRTTGQQSTSNQNLKRKARDGEESEYHSEDVEYESIKANRPTQRPTSTRKSRAAEVHNLSERRRRDRINEKMRALQELIPHCNKSDKASMLDEAIEYLKALQLQLQLMWMGSGMAPMMFPGVQQYMSRVGIGMGHVSMPLINNPIQLSRSPLVNNSMSSIPSANQMPMCPSPTVNPINFLAHMQNVHLPESYPRCFGLPHMQLPPQAMNLYTYGSHMVQQNQTAAVAGSSTLPTAGIPSENIQHGHSGKTAKRRFTVC